MKLDGILYQNFPTLFLNLTHLHDKKKLKMTTTSAKNDSERPDATYFSATQKYPAGKPAGSSKNIS